MAGPSTGYRVLSDREDLLKLKGFQEFSGKTQDIFTNAVQQARFRKHLQFEQILIGFQRVGKRLKPKSQVTPAQMVFICLLQNKTEVKRNQNGNETYSEFPWGYTTANINVRFSVEIFGVFLLNQIQSFETEKRRLPYYIGSLYFQ